MRDKGSGKKNDLAGVLSLAIILIITLLVTSILILSVGGNPLKAYSYLIAGAFGSPSAIINTLNKAVPIAFAGFAVAFSSKAGMFNIGIEGQLIMGGLGSVLPAIFLKGLAPAIHIPICLLCGMLFSMAYALTPAVLFIKRGANLLVMHILINSIGWLLITYFVISVFPGDNRNIPSTNPIEASAELPYLITSPNKLTVGILILAAIAFIYWFYVNKTTSGYELRVCGSNREAAKFAGINVARYQLLALLGSGALAGLAGGIEVLGTYHRLYDGFSPGYGFDGIPIAMLSGGHPAGILIGSFLFGALRVGSLQMQLKAGVSVEIISAIQGMLITLIAAQYIISFASGKLLAIQRRGK
jgi:simple sugar transport system permease protein